MALIYDVRMFAPSMLITHTHVIHEHGRIPLRTLLAEAHAPSRVYSTTLASGGALVACATDVSVSPQDGHSVHCATENAVAWVMQSLKALELILRDPTVQPLIE